jgi:alkyl hydroperoxide reductase subunit AhpC
LAELARLTPEFLKRGVKPIGLSTDKVLCSSAPSAVCSISLVQLAKHNAWSKDVVQFGKLESANLPYPIIADDSR